MNKPILTISIATYNRLEILKEQILVILPQLTDEVLLVIRDNNSSFDIRECFTESQLKKINYYKNAVNIGAEANIVRGYDSCTTDWLWALGDDDILKPDAIETVLTLIKKHSECAYINMGAKIEREVTGFEEFADVFSIIGAFANGFFMSNCLYNMSKLKPGLINYYKYLSSMIGQFIFVLKFLENNPTEKCFFSKEIIVKEQSLEISWSRADFIVFSSIIFDAFKHKRKILKRNIFKSLGDAYYCTIFLEKSIPLKTKFYLFKYTINKIGLINTFLYNKISIIEISMKYLLPESLYEKVKKKFMKLYNGAKNI